MLSPHPLHLANRLYRSGLAAVLLIGAMAAAPTVAHAQEFLSIKGKTVNIRAKPSKDSEIAWELINGYPVEVMTREGEWIKVKDFEGPLGWVYQPLTSTTPHFLIKANTVNLRSGPGTSHSIVAKLKKHDIVETLENQGEWAKVKTADGQEGWLSAALGWGW